MSKRIASGSPIVAVKRNDMRAEERAKLNAEELKVHKALIDRVARDLRDGVQVTQSDVDDNYIPNAGQKLDLVGFTNAGG